MKKSLILTLALAAAMPAMADLNGNGYYRVENFVTNRWVSVVDNRGSIDLVATRADLEAIRLQQNFTEVSSDAASVIYISKINDKEYEMATQGTGVHEIIDYYVHLRKNGSSKGQTLYMAYGEYKGTVRYLGDANIYGGDEGTMSSSCTSNTRKWYIRPIDAAGDNFFGVVPDVEVNGKLYTTLYADFPVSAYSEGVKFYSIPYYSGDISEMSEIVGTVPAGTPVIVECVGTKSTDNRLNVGGQGTPVAKNRMEGVFFNCDIDFHINRTPYDPKTMRVLGVCSDGSLGFVKGDYDYVPANTSYLRVHADAPDEIKCLSKDQIPSGVDEVGEEGDGLSDVYTITGILVGKSMSRDEVMELPKGMYIVGGKKMIIR